MRFFRGGGESRLEEVEADLQQMLADDRHSFDIATSALIGGADVEVVGPDLRETDHRVNKLEREIRRKLVVHASVQEAVDIPAILVAMSIVKDVERIGDYAKNIFDIAAEGADFSRAEDRDELIAYRDRISRMITEAGDVYRNRNEELARELISEGDRLQDEFDDLVHALVTADGPASYAVPRALFHRHLKRIVAHLMNVMTAVVMPLDKLDYFDEDAQDRSSRD
ncbi:MAG: hypothetical protein KY437_08385 [Actinobacteria bacterium]|nr:hypothetical protein [Actinomycetota bacterium]